MSRWKKRCEFTGKVCFPKDIAIRRAETWGEDKHGKWNGYACQYDNTHWHVGHNKQITNNQEGEER